MKNWATTLAEIQGSHDLRLSSWGPYSMLYLGISHIPDMQKAMRFDLSVFPGIYRRTAVCPTAKRDVGVYPWEAAPDLSYYRFRHELIWKDRLYCDVDYCRLDDDAVLVCTHLVNNTELMQPIALQYVASLNFPPLRPQSTDLLRPSQVELPTGAVWVNGIDYQDIQYNRFDLRANLTPDGHRRGEIRDHGFVDGNAFGQGFATHEGDCVTYRVAVPTAMSDAVLVFRYRMAAGQQTTLSLSGLIQTELTCNGTGEIVTQQVAVGDLPVGEAVVQIVAHGGGEWQLDGFALVPQASLSVLNFTPVVWNHVPERLPGDKPNSLILKYDHIAPVYGMAWENVPFEVRHIYDNVLEPWAHRMCIGALHNPNPTFTGTGSGHFTNLCLRPIMVPPATQTTLYGLICTGDVDQVRRRLADFDPATHDYAAINRQARAKKVDLRGDLAGEQYVFSLDRMAATTLSNVIYPVRTRGKYIKHYTPGRFYETLYTWDAGFIGLGLLEMDPDRALDMINAYVTEPGEPGAAFIHHGTPLPTQFYVFWELWNRTGSADILAYFYPRLRQYHNFLVGRYGGSTTRNLKSHLLRTWDYFYNSGGWDDYPPQAHVHANRLTQSVAPTANTAHAIRTAKMLRTMAVALGLNTDEYDEDIALFTQALQQWSWDAESGYFGYVCHDASGQPERILRHESGCNFNMGLDGVTPLVADICTAAQEDVLVSHITQEGRMWSPHGISTVDQTAPYYQVDGYWNGSVWMPHQWFLWKALLDLGKADEADQIASTGLEVWKREVGDAYACWEHINVKTGRGGGWHHFGGLSTPVLCWYGAYHRTGRLTGGHNLHVDTYSFDSGNRNLDAVISIEGQPWHAPVVIVTLNSASSYRVTLNGKPLQYKERYPGTLEIVLPATVDKGRLSVQSE